MKYLKKKYLKKLLDLASTNKFVKIVKALFLKILGFSIKLHIELVWFFSETTLGYSLFIMITLFVHFTSREVKRLPEVYQIASSAGFCFIYGLLGISAILFILCHINSTKRLLYELTGEGYIFKKLGNPGARPLIRLSLAIGGVVTADIASLVAQEISNHNGVDRYIKAAEQSGQLPNLETVERLLTRPPATGKALVDFVDALKGNK